MELVVWSDRGFAEVQSGFSDVYNTGETTDCMRRKGLYLKNVEISPEDLECAVVAITAI
jgi:hypothetical protein